VQGTGCALERGGGLLAHMRRTNSGRRAAAAAAEAAEAAEAALEGQQQPVRWAPDAGLGAGSGRRLLPECGVC